MSCKSHYWLYFYFAPPPPLTGDRALPISGYDSAWHGNIPRCLQGRHYQNGCVQVNIKKAMIFKIVGDVFFLISLHAVDLFFTAENFTNCRHQPHMLAVWDRYMRTLILCVLQIFHTWEFYGQWRTCVKLLYWSLQFKPEVVTINICWTATRHCLIPSQCIELGTFSGLDLFLSMILKSQTNFMSLFVGRFVYLSLSPVGCWAFREMFLMDWWRMKTLICLLTYINHDSHQANSSDQNWWF